MLELLLFYIFSQINSKKLIIISTITLKIFCFFFGFLNYFGFWIFSFFLVIYVWLLGLLSKYSNKFDAILLINFTTLIICVFFSAVLLFQMPVFWVVVCEGVFLFSMGRMIFYFSRKRQALNFRQKASEAFISKEYNKASQLLKEGIERASRMTWGPQGYGKTDLHKLLEKELLHIQEYEDIKNREVTIDLFTSEKLFVDKFKSKKNIKKHLIWVSLITSVIFFVVSLFLII